MSRTRPATLAQPLLLPTAGGGYMVVADDAPGPWPRIGDVEQIGRRWHARPMGAETSTHFATRRDAVAFITRVAA